MMAHAKLSASGAKRWMNCLGSPRLVGSLPPEERNRSSSYANEGNAAHAVLERCLRSEGRASDAYSYLGWRVFERGGSWRMVAPDEKGVVVPIDAFQVDLEMADAVAACVNEVEIHLDRLPGPELRIEVQVRPLDSRDDLFGTADVIIWDPFEGELVVVDFKYGKGVVIEVVDNEQAMYYALGALREVGVEAVARVTIVIAQPRATHADGPIRRWVIDAQALVDFSRVLEGRAAATEAPDAPLKVGEWCRFCPALAVCPEAHRIAVETAKVEFSAVPLDPEEHELRLPDFGNPAEVAQALNIIPVIDAWCREVQGRALRVLEDGGEIPGYKLVKKRARGRVWTNPEQVEKTLRGKRGVKKEDIYEIKLKSPTQMEKVGAVGKKWVAKHCEMPEGGRTMATDTDPRPAALPAKVDDFASTPLPAIPATAGDDSIFK